MAILIPGGTNYAQNPSYETNLNGYTTGNCSQARSAATSWVGGWAGRITVTTASGTIQHGMSGQSSNSYRSLCQGGQTLNIKVRVLSSSNVRSHQVVVLFRNASDAAVGSTILGASVVTSTSQYSEVLLSDVVVPSTAVSFDYYIRWASTPAVSEWIDVDGWEIRLDESFDTYIDGDQGAIYKWSGTAHNSTSVRLPAFGPPAIGRGGYVQMIPSLYRADINNNHFDDLSDSMIDATVAFTADGDIHMSFTATMQNPDQLTPYSDYLAPFLRLEYADGSVLEHQVGLFVVIPGDVTYTPVSSVGSVEGRSLEWLLSIDEFPGSYHVSAGVDYTAAVITILRDQGIPHFEVPISGKKLPTTKTWTAGTSKLAIINDLLTAVNFYPLHSDRHGRVKSFPRTDLLNAGSAASYVGDPITGNVTSSFTLTTDTTKFANQVIVSLHDANNTPIFVKVNNTNNSSPVSIPRLGFRKTIRLTPSSLPDNTTATQLANSTLQDASLRHVGLKLGVIPDPGRDPFEVYTVSLNQTDGTSVAAGLYYCTGWSLGFRPSQGAMQLNLNRVEVYQ